MTYSRTSNILNIVTANLHVSAIFDATFAAPSCNFSRAGLQLQIARVKRLGFLRDIAVRFPRNSANLHQVSNMFKISVISRRQTAHEIVSSLHWRFILVFHQPRAKPRQLVIHPSAFLVKNQLSLLQIFITQSRSYYSKFTFLPSCTHS